MMVRGKRAGMEAAELALVLLYRIKTLPPAVEFALLALAVGLALYWAYWEAERVWFNESLRRSPGLGAHGVVFLNTGDLTRRQYVWEFRNKEGAGAAFY